VFKHEKIAMVQPVEFQKSNHVQWSIFFPMKVSKLSGLKKKLLDDFCIEKYFSAKRIK